MTTRTVLRCTLAFFAALLLSVSANAQLFRAYLASDGNDANACNLPAPCRLLPAALNAVANGGEIWMLDSANYNTATVNITKSVSILAVPGAVGSVLAIGGPAISITSSGPVALRNLVIVPLAGGGGTNGINFSSFSSLTIEHSLIANLPGHGVYAIGGGRVRVAHSIIRNNAFAGVMVLNGAAAEIASTQLLGNDYGGLYVWSLNASTTVVNVSDSVISGGTSGVESYATNPAAYARATLTRCMVESAATQGLNVLTSSGSATIVVNASTITNNPAGFVLTGAGASIRSYGNNQFSDNGASTGSLTFAGLQ
jgi:hypothetical protein